MKEVHAGILGRLPAAAAAVLGLVLYCLTAYPAPDWLDGPALAAASYRLGMFHPPGSPLAVMLGHLCTLWPFDAPAGCLSGLSAVCAAASLYALARIVDDIFASTGPASRPVRHGSVFLLTLAFAVAPGPWSQAIRCEVYTLAMLLFLCALRPLCRVALTGKQRSGVAAERSMLYIGMCVAVHPLIALCAAVGALPLLSDVLRSPRRMAAALGRVALGATPLLLLPWMVKAPFDLRWGDPASPAGWFSFVLGSTFLPTYSPTSATVPLTGIRTMVVLVDGIGVPLLIASLVGGYLAARLRGRFGLVLLLVLLADVATLVLQRSVRIDNPDATGYALPAMSVVLLASAFGLAVAGRTLQRAMRGARASELTTGIVIGLLLVAHTVWGMRPRDRSDCHAGATMAARALSCLPEGTVVLLGDFNLVFMFDYLQRVEGMRPDVHTLYLRDLTNPALRDALADSEPALESRLPHASRLHPAELGSLTAWRPAAVDAGPHILPDGLRPAGSCGFLWLLAGRAATTEESLLRAQKSFFTGMAPPVCGDGRRDPRTSQVVAWHAYWQGRVAAVLGMERLATVLVGLASCAAPQDVAIDEAARRLGRTSRPCTSSAGTYRRTCGTRARPGVLPSLLLLCGLGLWLCPLASGQIDRWRLLSSLCGLCLMAVAIASAGS